MKTKILLWSVVSILTSGFADDIPNSNQSPAIVLKDGAKLTLAGVTYGRHHVPPNSQPPMGAVFSGNDINTPTNDSTVVWIQAEYNPGRSPSFQLLVSDLANTACVPCEKRTSTRVRSGVDVLGFVLDAFPRWDKQIVLRAAPFNGELGEGRLVIANPQPGFFGDSTATPLPNTQSDGDFEVTLTKFVVGARSPSPRARGVPTNDIANQCVHLNFDFKQNGRSVTNWHPWMVYTTDAAGNHVRSAMSLYPTNGSYPVFPSRMMRMVSSTNRAVEMTNNTPAARSEKPATPPALVFDGYYYGPGLWPDEPAWKVRMEFTRTSGFTDDEILTITNVPIQEGSQKDVDDQWTWEPGSTNSVFADRTVNGAHVKIFPAILHEDQFQPGRKIITVTLRGDPYDRNRRGMRTVLLQATDDHGRDLGGSNASDFFIYRVDFMNHLDAKTLNLKFALHKSRYVEFTVKPAKE